MTYTFKLGPELFFAALTGAVIFVFQLAAAFEPETIKDWETWLITAAGGLTRAIAAAGLAYLTREAVN